MNSIKSICKQIDKAVLVSFDLFDTLVIRPYLKPTDLFHHLENVLNLPRYAMRRIAAEQEARRQHPELDDITLDMIYNEIDDEFRSVKHIELEWEAMVLRPNPELKEVYEYAKEQNKRIIISTDMYLPSSFLAQLLQRCGYEGWEKLYVSNELKASKRKGRMYRIAIEECGVKASDILHIGDNKRSDWKEARKLGIRACLYSPPTQQFLASHPRYKLTTDKSRHPLGLSILLGMHTWKWIQLKCKQGKELTYWQKIGYHHAGPLAYGLARFVESESRAHKIDRVLFVARDGYTPQKIYNTFSSTLPHAYIYAPRILSHVCLMSFQRSDEHHIKSVIDYILPSNPELAEEYKSFKGSAYDFFIAHFKEMKAIAHRQMGIYNEYIKKAVKNEGKCAVVDSITENYSAQRLLEKALDTELHGIYWWHANQDSAVKRNCSFFSEKKTIHDGNVRPKMWNYVEFLLSSPEHPIKGVHANGEAIFSSNQSPYEYERSRLYSDIEEGALMFANDVKELFNGHDIFLSASVLSSWIDAFLENPTREDMREMRNIRFPIDSGHKKWEPMLIADIGIMQFLRSPKRAIMQMKRAVWRDKLQKMILCICKPFSINRQKNGCRLDFYILPYLQRKYFSLTIYSNNRKSFQLIIGGAAFKVW